MNRGLQEIAGVAVYFSAVDGKPLSSEQDALDLMGEVYGLDVSRLAIPTERLDEGFFDLETKIAGLMIQKFVNYQLPIVFIGDIPQAYRDNKPLNDYLREANRGRAVWFVRDATELADKLAKTHQS